MLWLLIVLLAERAWKLWAVERFFRRPPPPPVSPTSVSIVQPILSGDPTMPACLEQNLGLQTRHEVEWIWLVDDDDLVAQHACIALMARHPEQRVRLATLPPPAAQQSPKLLKLIAASRLATGRVLCVLDDDTVLPQGALEVVLPYLELRGVGLAFGLPFYVRFENLWSGLLSAFVNSNSLLTYIPYTVLAEPFTINGMFYALKRETLDAIGGFDGLEGVLADDFAVAQRVRGHGLLLAQTPLRHPISTLVTGPAHYGRLMHRWLVFPRESLLRHLGPRERAVLLATQLPPVLAPLLLVAALLLRPSRQATRAVALYLGCCYGLSAYLNARYLGGATPWRRSWLTLVAQLVLPLQLLAAFAGPQRVVWRGHTITVLPGGGLRLVRRGASDRR